MKKVSFIIAFAILFVLQSLEAQSTRKPVSKRKPTKKELKEAEEKAEKKANLKEKVWFGLYTNFPSISQNSFNVGISPMAAYKLTKTGSISAGLITKVDYSWQRDFNSPSGSLNLVDLSIGAFARGKLFDRVFLQAEYDITRFEGYNPNTSTKVGLVQNQAYIGAGWIQGFGRWRGEISFYYDALYNASSVKDNPFDLRFGATYNF